MTDPSGPCFVSYKRERAVEVGFIVAALRDHGVPTWQDIADLPSAVTESALAAVLENPDTSSAIIFMTPEVEKSDVIRKVEVPRILNRAARGDGFFAVPIAAGGADYTDLVRILGPSAGLTDISSFNVLKSTDQPIGKGFAAIIAQRALRERLIASARTTSADTPLTLQVATRISLPKHTGMTLRVDLSHRFNGRHALPDAWPDHILPAFAAIAAELGKSVPGFQLNVSGYPSLPAAIALGAAFPTVGPVRAAWIQERTTLGGPIERWALDGPDSDCGFVVDERPRNVSGTDLAVLVSATNDVVNDFVLSSAALPLRAILHVAPPEPHPARILLGPGEARNLAYRTVDAARSAVSKYGVRGKIHIFAAVPAGVAFMIGQQLNTFGVVQTYEHDPAATTPYTAAATLTPSG